MINEFSKIKEGRFLSVGSSIIPDKNKGKYQNGRYMKSVIDSTQFLNKSINAESKKRRNEQIKIDNDKLTGYISNVQPGYNIDPKKQMKSYKEHQRLKKKISRSSRWTVA